MRTAGLAVGFLLLVAAFWFGAVVAHMTPEPTTGYPRDLYAYFFPRYLYGARALLSGRLPLWNPHELCGVPFLASAQSGVLNPLAALAFGLLPPATALHGFFLLHFALTGMATYACARAIGLGWQGASLAAVAWTFSPALTRSIYVPSRVACLLWLPVVFLLAGRLVRAANASGAALLALALAAQACAGYPEFALDTGVLLGVFVLVTLTTRTGHDRPARVLAAFATAAVLALLLAGLQLVPTVELVSESVREAMTARPTLVPGPRVLETLFGLLPQVGLAYFGMLPALYLGVLPLALAVVGGLAGRSSQRWPYAACALACVLGVIGYRWLHLLPVYRLTRFALPWALLLPFFTAVLAGIGWERLVAGRVGRRPMVATLLLLGAAFAVLGTRLTAAVMVAAALLIGAAAARRLVFPLVLLVVLGDLFAHLPYWRGADPLPPRPRSATTRALVEALRPRAAETRFLGSTESLTGVAITDGLLSIAGLEDSAMPRRLRRLVDHFGLGITGEMPLRLEHVVASKPLLDLMAVGLVTGPGRWGPALERAGFTAVRAPAGDAHGLWQNPAALPRAFLVRTVRVVAGEDEAFDAVSAPGFRPADEAVIEQPPAAMIAPGPVLPEESARLVADASEQVRIATSTRRPALLVLTDTAFPGWQATIDGADVRILRANFAFRAVEVPAGDHRVVFRYRPASVRLGLVLSLAGMLSVAVVLGGGFRRARRPAT